MAGEASGFMGVTWPFDAVFCLSLADNIEKREAMRKEFERVGIGEDRLHWKITVKNAFYRYIWTHPNFHTPRWWLHLNGALNCTMGHYEIMLESLARGYGRILIVEDDVRFLKDISVLNTILENLPTYDIAMLDYNVPLAKAAHERALRRCRVNEHYFNFDSITVNGTSCYGLTTKAIKAITKGQEEYYRPADFIINKKTEDGLIRVAAVRNIAVQDMRLKGADMKPIDHHLYDGIANLEEYNL